VTAVLELDGLRAGYGRSEVVRGLSLRVRRGEVVALLGPNGAGKTTTLLTASGLLPALGGRIACLGAPVDSRAPHRNARRGLAHVTERRSVFRTLSVADNLKVAARGRPVEAGRVFPALVPLARRRAGMLSGGEQQMLAVEMALATGPSLLLLDEMSLGLAPMIVDDLARAVRRIADHDGVGVLLVEQHTAVALTIADHAVVLRHGEVVLDAPGPELSETPDRLRAAYLG